MWVSRALQFEGFVARARRRLRTMTFTLRVADIATRVVCDDPAVALTVSGAAGRFLVPHGQADVTIRVERAPHLAEPNGEKLFDSGLVWRLYRQGGDFVFSFTSASLTPVPYKLARFDPSFTSGTLYLNSGCLPDDRAIEPLEFPLPELLMINLLARGRGVEIHGCGVIDRDGTAYLFAGQSEAGKSTTARFWHKEGATILSDDRVILRLRDGQVWIYGTPWHGEEEFAFPASAPLSRLFFLDHGLGNRVRPMRGAAALAQLFACSFPPFHDESGLNFTLELLTSIIDRVPCFELSFLPDARVVSFVRAQP
jgi:hypothetical protein